MVVRSARLVFDLPLGGAVLREELEGVAVGERAVAAGAADEDRGVDPDLCERREQLRAELRGDLGRQGLEVRLEVLRPGDALEVRPGQRRGADDARGVRFVPRERGPVGPSGVVFEHRLLGEARVAAGERRERQVGLVDRRPVGVGGLQHRGHALGLHLLHLLVEREGDPVAAHRDVRAHVVQRVPVRIPGGVLPAVLGRGVAVVGVVSLTALAHDDDALHPRRAVGVAVVFDRGVVLEGLLEGIAGVAVRVAAPEVEVLADDVVDAAVAGPLPDDRRPGVDRDGRRCEAERPAVGRRADVDRDLALAGGVDDRPVEVVRAVEPAVERRHPVAVAIAVAVSVATVGGRGGRGGVTVAVPISIAVAVSVPAVGRTASDRRECGCATEVEESSSVLLHRLYSDGKGVYWYLEWVRG